MLLRLFGLLGILLAVSLGACQSSSGVARNAASLDVPDTTSLVQSGDLRIGPMDLLEVSVFGAPDLDDSYQVDFEGSLKMPLIGSFKAAGYTASELATYLEGRLSERFLQDPDVTVRIAESQDRLVTVDGSVEKPGMYPVRGQLTLLQAIALSGGPKSDADPRRIIIFRQIEGKRHAAGFDLKAIRAGEADDPLVYGNDIVVVDGSAARQRYGDFLRSVPLLALFLIY